MSTPVIMQHIELVDDGFGTMEAVISGTRITVHDIAALYVLNRSPLEWIVENYNLTPAQIYAALSYYYDHKEQIDREIAEADALAQRVGLPLDELVAKHKDKPA